MLTFSGYRSSPQTKQDLAQRLRLVRLERFGDHGVPRLAHLLDVPTTTWMNYENGVTIPGEILLAFLVFTDAEPRWLLSGDGMAFHSPSRANPPKPVIQRLEE